MATPANTRAEPAALLERERALSELEVLIAEVSEGAGRVAVIEGVAGIGKSRLLQAFGERAAAAGMRVLRARGGELERDLGWRVVRELLAPVVAGAAHAERKALFAGAARLAQPVLEPGREQPRPAGPDSVTAALQGLYWLTAELAARGPLALLVDDAQWADLPSMRWLAYLAARLEGVPVLLTVTARPIEPAPEGARLSALSGRALLSVVTGLARLLKLAPLSEPAGAELVRRALGSETDGGFASACHGATGGNPFLLGELLGALGRDRVAPTAANAGRVQEIDPQTVARAVLLRLSRLPPEAGELAAAVAVLGKDVRLRDAAELTGLDDEQAARAGAGLAASGILLDRLPLEFVHPIVRNAVYQELPAATRARRHERAATLLGAAGAASADIAVHLLHVEPGGGNGTVDTLVRAGEGELAAGAPDAAIPFLRRALAEPPATERRAHILHLLGHAETLIGGPLGFETLRLAYSTATVPRERAAIALDYSRAVGMIDDFRSAVEPLGTVLDELEPGSKLAAEVEAELIRIAILDLATIPVALERLAPFFADPESVEDPAILGNLALAAAGMGTPEAAGTVALARRALVAGELVNPGTAVYIASALSVAEELDAAIEIWDGFAAKAQTSGSTLAYGFACLQRANVHYRKGALAAAEEDARTAVEIYCDWAPPTQGFGFYLEVLSERDLGSGEAALARYRAADKPPETWGHNSVLFGRGRLRLAQGRYAEALDDLLECGRRLTAWGCLNPATIPWRSNAALALIALGEQERAQRLAEEDVKRARAYGAVGALGMALRAAGLVEGGAAGAQQLEDAVDILRGSPLQLELARALCDLGAARRRAGRRGDAGELLREGLDLAHACGAIVLAERARAELTAAGAKPRRDAMRGRDALTASELRVAEMAAAGMTNRDIAQALFVTVRTVETHLTHTYQKLDIDSRTRLAEGLGEAGHA